MCCACFEELPLAILQDRQLLGVAPLHRNPCFTCSSDAGELWRVGPGRMEVLARAIARRTGRLVWHLDTFNSWYCKKVVSGLG